MLAALFCVLAAAPAACQSRSAEPESVAVEARPVALNPSDSGQTAVDRLLYRGGLVLGADWKGFGGWSGLQISADGSRAILVSDKGRWLTARLGYDSEGRLSGLDFMRVNLGISCHFLTFSVIFCRFLTFSAIFWPGPK